MERKIVSGIMLALLLIGMSTLAFNIGPVRAETITETEPTTEYVDFHNGTRMLIIDYGNGTQDYVRETFLRKNAKIVIPESNINQSLSTSLPTSLEESTDYISITQTLKTEQEVLLGFTYIIVNERRDETLSIPLIASVKVGVDIDIRFGLRLPINITLEYPEQMTIGNNYTIYATLVPIDDPDFNEFLFTFKAVVWAEANVLGIVKIPKTEIFGPNIDQSKNFTTPLGPGAEPILDLEIDLFEMIKLIAPGWSGLIDLVSLVFIPKLVVEPAFGSEKITANASAVGDSLVVEGSNITWSTPGQHVNFTVHADDYDSLTNYTKISLCDLRYYFTNFIFDINLLFDLNGAINSFFNDPEFLIFAVDMSWLVEGLYLEVHEGYPRSVVSFPIYVERVIPPPERIDPRDVAILVVSAHPDAVYPDRTVNITVVAKNLGNVTESFNVTVYYDNNTIATRSVTNLPPREAITLTFLWNTIGLLECQKYTIWAEASTVPDEIDVTDNVYVDEIVKIKMLGDTNGDGIVDIMDVVIAAVAFGSYPGHPRWNPIADLNNDGLIDIFDLVIIGINFGKTG